MDHDRWIASTRAPSTTGMGMHRPLMQSRSPNPGTHFLPARHGQHTPPPQSIPVSRPFRMPSVHVSGVGDSDGDKLGSIDGEVDGAAEGEVVGAQLGWSGLWLGDADGETDGLVLIK